MGIQMQEKPKAKPRGASSLLELIPYEVVEVGEKDCGVEVGDIVLRFPSHGHGCYLLNVTKQKMLWDRTSSDNYRQPFMCLRAHHVATITFAVDHDDRPE